MFTLQIYALNGYYKYLFHPGIYRTGAIIFQHLYWSVIRKSVRPEVINCGNCKRTKLSNREISTSPAKLDEYLPWNKLCVYLIVPCVICRKGKKYI